MLLRASLTQFVTLVASFSRFFDVTYDKFTSILSFLFGLNFFSCAILRFRKKVYVLNTYIYDYVSTWIPVRTNPCIEVLYVPYTNTSDIYDIVEKNENLRKNETYSSEKRWQRLRKLDNILQRSVCASKRNVEKKYAQRTLSFFYGWNFGIKSQLFLHFLTI